ncbi:MAG TPA: citryl-CoA lyase [Candidatus Limnocylindrales bacterium]|jgi:citrate synthase
MRTSLGWAERDRVLVRGQDLTRDLLGRTTFGEMLGLVLLARRPTADETRMIDALLVVLVEHGLVKSAITARFVYSHAPEAMQAAVAASLLGAGSKHLGSSEWCARWLQEALPVTPSDEGIATAAATVVSDHAARHARIAGIGHHTHPDGDPRAVRLFQIARETGTYGPHCALLEAVSAKASANGPRPLPVNVTGAIAAIASDLGFRWQITRAFALIGRTLGSLGHIQEEMDEPLSDALVELVREHLEYGPGDGGAEGAPEPPA